MTGIKRTIGSLVRNVRDRNGWTLKQMSERTGIPISTLWKIERDSLSLTYDKLFKLGQSLNIRMADLFADYDRPKPPTLQVIGRRSLGTTVDALRIQMSNQEHYFMCPELRQKRMVPVLTRIRAQSIEEFEQIVGRSGEVFAHVLEGAVIVHTQFHAPAIVTSGASIYIECGMAPAYICAPGCREALILEVGSSAARVAE
jgi:transcriptional regulator with XRE-family HTH domain